MSFAICNPENIDKVDKGAVEEIAKIAKDGVTDEELDEAKKGYLQDLKVQRGQRRQHRSMLRSALYLGRTLQFEVDLEKKIAALTLEDVNQALSAHITPDRLVIIRAGDFKKAK